MNYCNSFEVIRLILRLRSVRAGLEVPCDAKRDSIIIANHRQGIGRVDIDGEPSLHFHEDMGAQAPFCFNQDCA